MPACGEFSRIFFAAHSISVAPLRGGALGVLPKRWRSGRGGKGGFYRSPAPASRSAGGRFFHAGLIGNAERLCGGLRAESAF